MEVLSRGRTHHLEVRPRSRPVWLFAALASLVLATPAVGSDVDVLGAWHVLVHYKDDNATHPERERWIDRVWQFEKAGSRLRWVDYPIVVFDDQSGRFDSSMGRSARVLAFWEPNEAQLADIEDGLAVNDRGSKSKTLRNMDGEWKTLTRNTAASASVISYVENWSIENGEAGPIFRREDILGGESSESLDGVTLYTTTAVEEGGNVLSGTFVRDGTKHGVFRMMRTARVEGLKTNGKTPNEKVNERAMQALEALGYDAD